MISVGLDGIVVEFARFTSYGEVCNFSTCGAGMSAVGEEDIRSTFTVDSDFLAGACKGWVPDYDGGSLSARSERNKAENILFGPVSFLGDTTFTL